MTTGTAPWWGEPVITGAFVLSGVALAQIVVLRLNERSVRTLALQRWDVQRLAEYTALAQRVREVECAWLWVEKDGSGLDEYYAAVWDLTPIINGIELIGGPALLAAAHQLDAAIGVPFLMFRERNVVRISDETAAEMMIMLMQARRAFIEEARIELGVGRFVAETVWVDA